MRFKFAMLLCAIGVVSLTACSKPDVASNAAPVEPSTAPVQIQTDAKQAGYPELLKVVVNTRAAVEANDFKMAQQEFDQFEGAWSPVEDGIKAKSPEAYDAIEADMEQVMTSLRAADANKALDALQTLDTHIQSVSSAPAQVSTPSSGYPQLTAVVANTKLAVEANDFQKAQQEFDQFEGVWSPVEDGIKAKSPESYDAIETSMDQITASLRASETDKAMAALQTLDQTIQGIPNS